MKAREVGWRQVWFEYLEEQQPIDLPPLPSKHQEFENEETELRYGHERTETDETVDRSGDEHRCCHPASPVRRVEQPNTYWCSHRAGPGA